MDKGETIEKSATGYSRKTILLVGVVLVLFVGLTVLEVALQGKKGPSILPTNVIIFALINLNILVLMVFMLLLGRNLVKLYFERRSGAIGSKFKTKLVLAFIGLSIIPTLMLFLVASGIITSLVDSWFSVQQDLFMKESLSISQEYLERWNEEAERIFAALDNCTGLKMESPYLTSDRLLNAASEHGAKLIEVFGFDGRLIAQSKYRLKYSTPPEMLKGFLDGSEKVRGEELAKTYKVFVRGKDRVMVVTFKIPSSVRKSLNTITNIYQGYQEMKSVSKSVKWLYIISFLVVTMLILFSSMWIGLQIAKGITVPIEALAKATEEVAAGDLDVSVGVKADDEIGILVNSFNSMTQELKKNRRRLEEGKRYIETVLESVATGVISLDKEGKVISINAAARNLLGIGEDKGFEGGSYRALLSEGSFHSLMETIRDALRQGDKRGRSEVRLVRTEGVAILNVGVTPIYDQGGKYDGMVIVLEDMTELAKAQRAAAWEEVARRVAHEIKNPLTPIKLSAQRMKRRVVQAEIPEDEKSVMNHCIDTIIDQVDLMRNMVNEFHQFARFPKITPVPCNVEEMVDEVRTTYHSSHPKVEISIEKVGEIPTLMLDKEQMKRVLMNLVDNAIEAMKGKGRVEIRLLRDKTNNQLVIEVKDEGEGIPAEERELIFQPYFTTKEGGTGLGLAIVNRIVTDHGGYIRVRPNRPKGSVFVIELPITEA